MVSRNIGFRFSFVSYNILSQTYLNEYSHLYANCSPRDLEWPRRGHKIVTQLMDDPADIICLQEVHCDHLKNLFQPKLKNYGYDCLYKKKTGERTDGCAIFYKTESFNLSACRNVEFRRPDLNHILSQRDNVGIIAVLEPKFHRPLKSTHLVVANTHLLFNPRRSDVRLAQMKLLLAELQDISLDFSNQSESKSHFPTILCGDLNSSPDSIVNELITKNYVINSMNGVSHNSTESRTFRGLSDRHQSTSSDQSDNQSTDTQDLIKGANHNFKFRSVYPIKNRRGEAYVSCFANCIVDYIFYTPHLILESCLELLTQVDLQKNIPMPNSHFPSDHISLEAKFRLE